MALPTMPIRRKQPALQAFHALYRKLGAVALALVLVASSVLILPEFNRPNPSSDISQQRRLLEEETKATATRQEEVIRLLQQARSFKFQPTPPAPRHQALQPAHQKPGAITPRLHIQPHDVRGPPVAFA